MLNAAERPALLVGAGALHAREEVLAVAEALQAPVIKTLPGKAVVPDDSLYTTGGIGLLGTRPSEELVEDVDVLFMVGTNFPYAKHLPEPGKTRFVQLEADPARAGTRVPTEVPMVGDAKEGLAALLSPDRDPIAPQYLAGVLDELAAEDAIMTCDSGTVATWAARHWTIRGGREFYLSGNLASMAPGLPYAIAEALAFDGPALVDVDVNPDEPPMPGKVSYDQAKHFAQAFLKGQPRRASIATTLFKDRIQKLGE
ncbi:hypothetical protein [Thermoactinospora rubra]|uniref:hypothetical protein n=1 Tax=Thermoactinospora rubra TaxID=1088767 RepID=UPI001F0ABF87|nr:hypothetical protein [Thermoactinospora rubra]